MKITSKILLISVLIFSLHRIGKSQNFVNNPSFENITSCPMGPGEFPLAIGWDDVNNNVGGDSCSSPDLIAGCSWVIGGVNSPNMLIGNQNSRTGANHAGLILRDGIAFSGCSILGSSDYREYIQGSLSSPLLAGQQYCVEFYINLAGGAKWGVNKIGVYFSNTLVGYDFCVNNAPLPVTPQLQYTGSAIMDTTNWVQLQWSYTATGGEQYFVIGNFFDDASTPLTNSNCPSFHAYAYYFIDDVSVSQGVCCTANINPAGPFCSSASSDTLTAGITGGTWSGSGITNTTAGVFSPSVAGVGSHTIYYTMMCGMDSITITVTTCATLSVCIEPNGDYTVSGGAAPYTWQQQTSTLDCSGCPFGICNPPFCSGVTVNNWSTFATGSTVTPPGTFPIQATDNNGNTLIINSATGLPACSTTCPTITVSNTAQGNVSCFGGNNGTATVSGGGGTGPYSYSWAPSGGSSATATGLMAGTYTVSVTDANSCPGTITVTITEPTAALSSNISNSTDANCGQNDGSATVSVSGGTTGYSYSWSSGGSAATENNLAPGSYTVTITDANNCTTTATATVGSLGGPTSNITTQTNVTCNGGNNGQATVVATGGTSPYTYNWSPSGGTLATGTGFIAGVYIVTITDNFGCLTSDTVTITEPSAMVLTTSFTPASCGLSDGSASVSVSGGSGTYTYNWIPSGGTGSTASNIPSGNYTVEVTDANNCTQSSNITVNNSGGATASISSQTNINCNGGNNGEATVSVTGGTSPYTYSWSPSGGTAATASGLIAGTYTVTVTDAGGCITSESVIITEPAVLVLNTSFTPASCGLSDGSASVSVSGGTGTYTYSWAPVGGTGPTASNIPAGNYLVTVTDANNCVQTANVTVINSSGGTANIGTQANVSCNGGNDGVATVSITGGTSPYTYSWSPSGGSLATASGLTAGTYFVTVTDNLGCITTDSVAISEPTAITITSNVTHPSCGNAGGIISVTAAGGMPGYSYSWQPGGDTTSMVNDLAGGSYIVTVFDDNLCSYSDTIVVNSGGGMVTSLIPTSATIDLGDSIQIVADGGASYSWVPPTGLSCFTCPNPTASPDSTTTYIVTIKDSSGCMVKDTITIIVEERCGKLFVPTIFSPNNDGRNDNQCVMGNCIASLTFTIYDRWGEKIFETNNSKDCWDGTHKGKKMNSGVFVYKLDAVLTNGKTIRENGNITLVR